MKNISRKYLAFTIVLLSVAAGSFLMSRSHEVMDRESDTCPAGNGWTIYQEEARYLENQLHTLNGFIFRCQRVPLNLEDSYKVKENECDPPDDVVTPWVDFWGRPYQIRYNNKRMKLQIRSHGKLLKVLSDDIVREMDLFIGTDVYDSEIEKCKNLSSEDRNCIFNRGWH